jgi:ribosomal protein L11 methyltransferase
VHEEAWRARLALPECDLVIHARPGRPFARLETYHPQAAPLRKLQNKWGGQLDRIDWLALATRANAPRRPRRLHRDLGVLDAGGRWPASQPAPRVLLRVAGAMAFGTGEHATTSACLRFLCAEAGRLGPRWTALDIGTGSAILAMAAEKLGAARVQAFDRDPRAIPAARANLRRNHCRRVTLTRRDLAAWRPRRRFHVVVANIFSEILRANAMQIITALRPGAVLILSGILRPQEKETLVPFLSRGLLLEKTARRGQWVTLQLRAGTPPGTPSAGTR